MEEQNWYIPFPLPGRENQPLLHHHSIRALQESGKTCRLCFLIGQARRERLDEGMELQYRDLDNKPFDCCWFRFYYNSQEQKHWELYFVFNREACGVYHNEDFFLTISRADFIHEKSHLSRELWEKFLRMEDLCTSSNRSFATLEWWLSDCQRRHKTCGSTSTSPWLPTRLIDVETQPKLVISDSMDTHMPQPYITLSHCWGTLSIVTLTTSTIATFQTAIPVATLPKTFLDAIVVTRKLGFRYLWIDSLCIMQDSEVDWRPESSVMGQVYKRSTLTISALDSENGQGGLFRQRNATEVLSCPASLRLDESGAREDIYVHSCTSIAIHEIGKGPLSESAWTIQERLLSPRVVYFGHTQIFWECLELHAGEAFPHGINAWPSAIGLPVWTSIKKQLSPPSEDGETPLFR